MKKPNLSKLGYSHKWIAYGLLDEPTFNQQLAEFNKEQDENTGQYRYTSLMAWLKPKKTLTNKEVDRFLEIASQDEDKEMAGSAVKELFISPIISESQFGFIASKMPPFGKGAKKLATREVLTKRLKKEELTEDLFVACFDYKLEFKDNRLIDIIIQETEDTVLLDRLASSQSGKQIRTRASKKLRQVRKEREDKD